MSVTPTKISINATDFTIVKKCINSKAIIVKAIIIIINNDKFDSYIFNTILDCFLIIFRMYV